MNRALLVGINAYPSQPLSGCVNDVIDIAAYLEAHHRITSEQIERLCDERATKAAIVRSLRSMIRQATVGDHLLFHFSGHGTQMPSSADDEPDGLDEVLCPVDFDWTDKKALKDDDLRGLLAELPDGVTITCVLDACHSGDFDRAVGPRSRAYRFLVPPSDAAQKMRRRHRIVGRLRAVTAFAEGAAILVPACTSSETAADTSFDGRPNGAFTYHFVTTLRRDGNRLSLRQVVEHVSDQLAGYNMHPVPSGIDDKLNARFLVSEDCSPSLEVGASWDSSLEAFLEELIGLEQRLRARFGNRPLPPQIAGVLEQLNAMAPRARGLQGSLRRGLACRSFPWGLQVEIPRAEIDHFMDRSNGVR